MPDTTTPAVIDLDTTEGICAHIKTLPTENLIAIAARPVDFTNVVFGAAAAGELIVRGVDVPTPEPPPDIEVQNEGTIFLFRPLTPAGHAFLAEHAPEDAQWYGPALCVEHRYAQDWAQHALDAGLKVA